ncbi:MAG: colanic acid/amylovoran biosynthesis glycosyltransferase [Colwellia sp.]|jgi:colanic acid/amylovoran biosynthesis glycosyltransferase
MKIAIFVDQFPVRSQTFVLNQITGLIDLGVDVQIIALHKGNQALFDRSELSKYQLPSRCIYLEQKQISLTGKITYRLRSILAGLCRSASFKRVMLGLNPALGKHSANLMLASIAANLPQPLTYDWIVCHFGPNGVLADKLRQTGAISGKIATIFHGSDMSAQKTIGRNRRDYKRLFNEAELLLPISELWRDKLFSLGCPPHKVVVHRMGVDLQHFTYQPLDTHALSASENGLAQRPPFRIFTAARFTEKKGLRYAIESLLHLPKHMKVNYQIGGYGDLEDELRTLVHTLDLSDSVTFCGPLNADHVKAHMLAADVFLQPSIVASDGDMEGVPVAIMEAMAVGTPVIATYHSAIPELIIDEQHGLLVPERAPQAIADKLLALYSNASLGQSIVLQARKRIESSANVKVLNQQLMNLLDQRS